MAKINDLLQRFGTVTVNDIVQKLRPATSTRIQEVETKLAEANKRLDRAYEAGFGDGFHSGEDEPPLGDIATFGYRRAAPKGLRDFSQLSYDQIIHTVWTLYQSNGVAKRALVLNRDHILGRRTRPIAIGDEALQEILDDFWRSNKLSKRIKKFLIGHALFGELCLPVFVRKADGRVKLAQIDPGDIESVLTHPHNALEQWIIVCKEVEGKRRIYRIIREDEGFVLNEQVISPKWPGKLVTDEQATLEPWEQSFLASQKMSRYTGSAFYFDKNNVSNQPRGFSDLLQSADPLDQLDETLFGLGEREAMAGYYSWDVTLQGATPEDVQMRSSEVRLNPPVKKGAINMHNDTEIWKLEFPNLRQPGTVATAQALKVQALEGLNQPVHWHGEEGTPNRATAESASSPTNKSLEHEQDNVRDMIIELCEFVRDQAEIAGLWQPQEITSDTGEVIGQTGTIDVMMPEIVKRDLVKLGPLLTQVVQAMTVAHLDLQVVTRETVARTIAKVAGELGIEYDPDEELARIDAKQDVVPEAEAVALNEWLRDRLNGG